MDVYFINTSRLELMRFTLQQNCAISFIVSQLWAPGTDPRRHLLVAERGYSFRWTYRIMDFNRN